MAKTLIDYRLGGAPVYRIVADKRENLMRLPDEVQKCVVFLGRKEPTASGVLQTSYGGTAFFVGVSTKIHGAQIIYLVTAAHVARQINDGEFCIRCNTLDGKSKEYWLDAGTDVTWWYHPDDPTVDVAVLPWAPPAEVDFKYIPESMFLNPEKMLSKGIGVGDEAYVTGLFSFVTGKKRNLPVVRTGNLSMVPSERVPNRRWHKDGLEAYLIELRSISGISGSPVFVQRSIEVHAAEHSGRKPVAAGAVFWLGLVHGHWDIGSDQVDGIWGDAWRKKNDQINTGMAIVVPSHNILGVIEQSELKEYADNAVQEFEMKNSALLDSTSPSTQFAVKSGKEEEATRKLTSVASAISEPSSANTSPILDSDFLKVAPHAQAKDANPHHREDFTSLLGEAARKPKRAD